MNLTLIQKTLGFVVLSLILASFAIGGPSIDSNSISARHDLLLLRDTKSIESATLTWPWPLGRQSAKAESDNLASTANERFGSLYQIESKTGQRPVTVSIAGATDRLPFRSFGYQPREQFETSVNTSWLSEWFAGNLQMSFADNPSDGNEFRLDGSYFSVAAGNWVAAIDQVERWWGPGWDGSLILSNSARPVPAISLTRISPEPFDWKALKWIGPWTFTTFMGQMDNEEPVRENGIRVGSDARLFGMRIDFSPFGWDWLDIGLNRGAQWAGEGRPGGLGIFKKLLIGEDNAVPGSETTKENEPGNQLAGVDWRLNIGDWNFAQYGQIVGEDEETFLPDANMLLFGVETWGELESLNATYRIYYEWADTRAGHLVADKRQNNAYNIAYNHGIYKSGYRSKGNPIGHAMDGDGLMRSLGAFIVKENGNLYGAKLRKYAINRDGQGPNSVSIDPLDGWSFELFGEVKSIDRIFEKWEDSNISLNFGIHYINERNVRTDAADDDIGAFIGMTKSL